MDCQIAVSNLSYDQLEMLYFLIFSHNIFYILIDNCHD